MRKLIRKLINEALLAEGREENRAFKKSFQKKIRKKYPSIDKAYYVHWISPWDGVLGADLVRQFDGHTELSVNLVDPSGRDVRTNRGGDWYPVGVVFQGVATYGHEDNLGGVDLYDTDSGERNDISTSAGVDELIGLGYNEFDFQGGFSRAYDEYRKGNTDIEDPDFFIKPQRPSAINYSSTEFIVIPKNIVGVVGITEDIIETIRRENIPHDLDWKTDKTYSRFYTREFFHLFVRKVSNDLNVPAVIGRDNISKFYKKLYSNLNVS